MNETIRFRKGDPIIERQGDNEEAKDFDARIVAVEKGIVRTDSGGRFDALTGAAIGEEATRRTGVYRAIRSASYRKAT